MRDSTQAAPVLKPLLADPDVPVRTRAAVLLAKWDDPAAWRAWQASHKD